LSAGERKLEVSSKVDDIAVRKPSISSISPIRQRALKKSKSHDVAGRRDDKTAESKHILA
jgi:hypothetical protein